MRSPLSTRSVQRQMTTEHWEPNIKKITPRDCGETFSYHRFEKGMTRVYSMLISL